MKEVMSARSEADRLFSLYTDNGRLRETPNLITETLFWNAVDNVGYAEDEEKESVVEKIPIPNFQLRSIVLEAVCDEIVQ